MSATKKSRNGDCISNLHESVMSQILSRLSTKDAVRTSVLSKTWKCKWTCSYNVDIVTEHVDSSFNKLRLFNGSLRNFMDRILVHSQHLTSLCLVFKHCFELNDVSHLETWISNVLLRHNIENLSIEIHRFATMIDLPCSILSSTSLRRLNLWVSSGALMNVVGQNVVPNLVSLDLYGVNLVNVNSDISTVTFNLPLLETFKVAILEWSNVKTLEIYAPSLTTFVSQPMYHLEEYDYSIVIVAPRLASFTCSGFGPEEFMIVNGSPVLSAFLLGNGEAADFQDPLKVGIRVSKLLNGFTNLEELELYGAMGQVFRVGPPLSCHDKLRRLTLSCWSTVEEVLEFLHAAPSLKFLSVLVNGFVDDCDYESMEYIPSCIASHLEEVKFLDFCCGKPRAYLPGGKVYFGLLNFLLENGDYLKKLSIRCCTADRLRIGCEIEEYVSELLETYPGLTINME